MMNRSDFTLTFAGSRMKEFPILPGESIGFSYTGSCKADFIWTEPVAASTDPQPTPPAHPETPSLSSQDPPTTTEVGQL